MPILSLFQSQSAQYSQHAKFSSDPARTEQNDPGLTRSGWWPFRAKKEQNDQKGFAFRKIEVECEHPLFAIRMA